MNPYTTISNSAVDDDRLTAVSLGILVWLLRQPEGAGITARKIKESLSGTGLAVTSKALSQLEELGYLKRVQVHRNGRFQTGEYVVTDSPEA
jgi:hypothetical protein